MKVLYIGHYKEFGGWAQTAANQILALDKAGVDVVCRNVTLTSDKKISGRLAELDQKSTEGCDICIQHVLPHHLVGTSRFKKNIAFLETESVSIKHLPWFDQLRLVDEIWVPNSQAKQFLEADNIDRPVSVIPHPCDVDKYRSKYQVLNLPQTANKFVVYYMGDLNDRKNLESIVTCFHSEFDKDEDAILLLKVNKFGVSPEDLNKVVEDKLARIKSSLRLYGNIIQYKKDVVITQMIDDHQVNSLHQAGDCFLCPSHGEAWSIPSFDAMAFGNTPICSNFGGPRDFITPDARTGKLIDGVYQSCKSSDAAFPDIFTAKEHWITPCEMSIKSQLRQYFEEWKENPVSYKTKTRQAGLKRADEFSYEKVGNKMKETLNV
jgi:glycosyltransferase involved in cell wall biosynthesis